jgi:hypothetical protein
MAEDRARDPRRSPDMENERERRRAHLKAGGTIENYDRSHYPQEYKDKLKDKDA